MSEFKQKQVFSDNVLEKEKDSVPEELTAQKAFSDKETLCLLLCKKSRKKRSRNCSLSM